MNYAQLTNKLNELYKTVEKDSIQLAKAKVLTNIAATINSIQKGKLHADIKLGKNEKPIFYTD